jgi:hypothetical protein
MSGWKSWSIGEVVEAGDFQDLVQDQVVQTYADSDARGSALGTAVSEGMMAFTADDKNLAVYANSNWNTVSQAISPNYIINGAFDIWQRGTSFSASADQFTVDRWFLDIVGGGSSSNVTRQTFTPAELEAAGFGDAKFYTNITVSPENTGLRFRQRIEDVQTLAGQTVTLSFWAKSADSIEISSRINQIFGSGGSSVVTTNVNTTTLTSTWQRYVFTGDLPSLTGKTIGVGSCLEVRFSTTETSGSYDLWGVQLEAGSVATPFRRNANSIQGELAACQRYYYRTTSIEGGQIFANAFANSTTQARGAVHFPTQMRIPPTALEQSGTATDYRAQRQATTTVNCSAVPAFITATETAAQFSFTFESGLVAGEALQLRSGAVGAFLGWSAEL